jgi:hypothetical protein
LIERLTCLLEGDDAVDDCVDIVDGEGAVHVLEARILAVGAPLPIC